VKNKENFRNLILTNNKFSNEVGKKLIKYSDKLNFNDTSFISKEYYYLSEKYIDFMNFQDKYKTQYDDLKNQLLPRNSNFNLIA
jgi:hypothetical protein